MTLDQLYEEKLKFENEITFKTKMLHRTPKSQVKLIDILIDEIEILKIDLHYINEDIERLS
jgi:hypothetical protein